MAEQAHFTVRGGASHSRSIGITQRATPLAVAWTGDQRVRFSDFQVNEIAMDGKPVHLRHIGSAIGQALLPQEAPAPASEASHTEKDTPETTKCVEPVQEEQAKAVSPEDVAVLSGLAGDRFANELVQFYQGGSSADGAQATSVTSEPMDDKSKRAQIHGEVRRIFRSTIETSTDASGAILATRVSLRKGKKWNRRAREAREDKPAGEYLHFTLYKDNRDTMDAVNQIARVLRIKPQSIGYAGTKDRRASTAQRCSLRHVRQRALAGCSSKLWGIETGDYEYRDEPIHLGQLLGNEFVIVIKNCKIVGEPTERTPAERLEALKTQVQAALDLMTSRGWINYFGHQRFGTYQIGTHEIGKLIIGGKWEDAVMALLSYDEEIASRAANGEVPTEGAKRDQYARHHACMLFKTGQDPEKAAKLIPGRFAAESCIVRHLTRSGKGSMKDYAGALTHITRGLRSMYLHAYQSHVWNHAASRRWELHGDKVVQGDLVIAEGEAAPLVSGQDQDGDDIVNPVEDEDEASVRARPLTEEEASSGSYTIHDVVLPSPGYDVVYPDNEVGKFYEEFMAREENGGMDPHNMRRLRREFSLPGRYRKLMGRFLATPSVDFGLYSDDVEQMHPTDLDLVRIARKSNGRRKRDDDDAEAGASKRAKVDGEERGDKVTGKPEQQADDEQAAPQGNQDEGKGGGQDEVPPADNVGPDKVAAIVKFQLGSSAYATVVLRELMGDLPDDTNEAKTGAA